MSAIIEEAPRNESVQTLYDEVNALTPISVTFEPAVTGEALLRPQHGCCARIRCAWLRSNP